jgi:signal transduction histidine kinase
MEVERTALARTLHDDLGGLLVGTVMDLDWITQRGGHSDQVLERLARATALLRAAIDMKRELIENLRPTLLDNVGLFSTLKWHLKACSRAAGVAYVDQYPAAELLFGADLKIGVFRLFQEALKHVLAEGTVSQLSLDVGIINSTLHCHLRSQLLEPLPSGLVAHPPPEASMHQRALPLGGIVTWHPQRQGNYMHLQVPFPSLSESRP